MTMPTNVDPPIAPAQSATQLFTMPRLSLLQGSFLIAILACVAYLPSLNGRFLLDDDVLLTDSPYIAASDGLYSFWLTTEPVDYYPVFNTTFWIEWRLWGANPAGYRFTNLLLHVASAVLIWAILQKLLVPGAFLAALLFTVHPVNVDSVAWIAQRKDLLALVFFLFSILWYLKSDEFIRRRDETSSGNTQLSALQSSGRGWYWLSLLAFLLAMLSKGTPAILPIALLGLAWWQQRRITGLDMTRAAPFFLIAVALSVVNIIWQNRMLDQSLHSGFAARLSGAGAVVWFYLAKAILPINLLFVYPPWLIETGKLLWWLPLSAAISLSAWLMWQTRVHGTNWSRSLWFAWAFYCVALLPVMGFADIGFMKFSFVADRYQHIAIIAWVALVAAGWNDWHERGPGAVRSAALATAVAVVAVLTILTRQHSQLYSDPILLYQATLEKNPDSALIRNNLGGELDQAGRPLEAIEQYQQAVRLKPDFADAFNNLGIVLGRLGRIPEAIAQFQQALTLNPNYADAHSNLGLALFKSDRMQEAIEQFEAALRLQPNFAKAHAGLAAALSHEGRFPEAVEHYQLALKFKPLFTEACAHLAETYAQMHQSAEAIAAAQRAIDLARSQGQAAFESQIQAWLDNFLTQQSNTRDTHE